MSISPSRNAAPVYSFRLKELPFLTLGIAVAFYLTVILPEFWNCPLGYDFFYSLWRAKQAFVEPLSVFGLDPTLRFHPLHFVSVGFLYGLSGLHPWGYGLANALLHVLNVLLLFAWARLVRMAKGGAAVAAIFFLFLSIQWGTIWDLQQSARLACVSLFLLSMLGFVGSTLTEKRSGFLYTISLLLFLLSFGFNEDSVTLPVMLLVTAGIFLPLRNRFSRVLLLALPFFLLSGFYSLISIQMGTPQGWRLHVGGHVLVNLLSMGKEFLHALLIPRPEFVSLLPLPSALARLLPLGAVVLFLGRVGRDPEFRAAKTQFDRRIVFWAAVWTVVTSFPYVLRPMDGLWQARYLYLPAMGVALLAGSFVHDLWLRLRTHFLLRLCLAAILASVLALNVVTNLYMARKARSQLNAATPEELPLVFSLVSEIRKNFPHSMEFPPHTLLVVEGIPIRPDRLKELLATYVKSLPSQMIEVPEGDLDLLQKILTDPSRDEVIYLKRKKGETLRSARYPSYRAVTGT